MRKKGQFHLLRDIVRQFSLGMVTLPLSPEDCDLARLGVWQVPHHSGIRNEAQLTHRQTNATMFLEQQLEQVKELSFHRKELVEQ